MKFFKRSLYELTADDWRRHKKGQKTYIHINRNAFETNPKHSKKNTGGKNVKDSVDNMKHPKCVKLESHKKIRERVEQKKSLKK